MKILDYKVLDKLQVNTIEKEMGLYILIREPVKYYKEYVIDDNLIGLLFNKEYDITGVTSPMEHIFNENEHLTSKVKKILKLQYTDDKYNSKRQDQVLFHYYDFLTHYFNTINFFNRPSFYIQYIREDEIMFSNGRKMTFDHEQDCCEHNYADFMSISDVDLDYVLREPLTFELVDEYGFRFGNEGKMISVPCYSEQNGYYSDDVNIFYNDVCMLNAVCKHEFY